MQIVKKMNLNDPEENMLVTIITSTNYAYCVMYTFNKVQRCRWWTGYETLMYIII